MELSPQAEAPAVIAGGYLNCTQVPTGSDCTLSINAKVSDFPFGKAWVIHGSEATWTETTFIRQDLGKFHIDVPSNLTSGPYGVAFGSADAKQLIATWIVQPTANLVQNGSFESYAFENVGNYFFLPDSDSPWNIASSPLTPPCSSISMEVFRTDGTAQAGVGIDGRNYAELNSWCNAGGPVSNSYILSQTLPLTQGHLYELQYRFARNPAVESNTLAANINDQRLATQLLRGAVGYASWVALKLNFVAPSAQGVLSFFETESNATDKGTRIDDIRVLSLGKGPR